MIAPTFTTFQAQLGKKWAEWTYVPTGSKSRIAKALLISAVAFVGVVMGIAVAMFGGLFAFKPVLAAAVPVVLILGFMFLLARPSLLFGLLLFRAGLDPILDGTQLPLGGASMGLGGVLNGLIIILTISALLEQPTKQWRKGAVLFAPLLALLLIGVFRSPLPALAIKQFLSISTVFCAFLLGIHLAERHGYQHVIKITLASCIIPFGVSALMLGTGWKFGYTARSSDYMSGSEAGRFAGPFSHANVLAFYLLTLTAAGLHMRVAAAASKKAIRLATLVMLGSLVLLLMTKTRSAWAACALLLAVHALLFERKLIPVLILGGLAALSLPEVRERIFELKEQRNYLIYAKLDSYAWRKLIWSEGLNHLNPAQYIFGKGTMSFYDDSLRFFSLAGGEKRYPHSIYVQLIYENGIVGLMLYAALLLQLIVGFSKAFRANRAVMYTGVMLTMLYAAVCYSDNVFDYLVFNIYIWITLGALFFASRNTDTQPKPNLDNLSKPQGIA